MARPTESMLTRINSLLIDGKPYTADDVEVFRSRMVDGKRTTYYTVIQEDLRQKFRLDADSGKVALMFGHDRRVLPVGRSFAGESVGDVVYGYFYVPKGKTSIGGDNNVNTDDVIEGIKDGRYRATSVGFNYSYEEDCICSICGAKAYSSDCPHVPGKKYDGKTCETLIYNRSGEGQLYENSIVFAGAVDSASFVPVPVTQQSAATYEAAGVDIVTVNGEKFVLKPMTKYCTPEEGGIEDMDTKEFVETVAKLTAEKTTLESELTSSKSDLDGYKAEAESHKITIGELTAKLTEAEKKVLESEPFIGLVKEYGIKALGSEFKDDALEGKNAKELSTLLGEYITKFLEAMPSGRQNAHSEPAPKTQVNTSVYRVNRKY